MSVTLGDIILYLGADDSRLNSTLKGVEGKTQGWVNGLGGKIALGLGAIVTTAIGGATALGLAAFKAGSDLDAAYDTLLIKTGASNEELQKLQENFRSVFTDIPTQAQPAADVLSTLSQRTTLLTGQTEDLAKQLLESARVLGGDAAVNTEAYTRMMGDWSISNEDASATLDKVFVASQNTGIGMDRLMQLAVQFGSPMRLMGFTLEDTISLLSKWEKEGVNTELVMGSLRIAAGKFADEGKPLRESLLATFDSIKNNTDATAALSEGMDVFGARAGPDMVAAIREGRFEFDELLAVLQDSDGAIMDTAKSTMDWGEKLQILKNKATVALAPIGMRLMDLASVLVDKAGPALDKLAGLLDQYVAPAIDKAADALEYLLGWLSDGESIFTVFEDGSSILGGFFERLGMGEADAERLAQQIIGIKNAIDGFVNETLMPFVQEHGEEIKAALIGIGVALAAAGVVSTVTAVGAALAGLISPIGLVIALVALLSAAWAGNWGGIQQKTFATIEFLKALITGGIQFINNFVNGRLGLLSQMFNTAWTNIKLLFQAFQAAFNGDWHRFGEILRQIWDNNWKMIGTILTTAWTNIKTGVKNGIQAVKSFFTETDWGNVGEGIIQGIARGITGGLRIIRDAAKNAAQAALDAAKGFLGIESPSKVFAEEVGKPSAEGFGQGFAQRMGEIGPDVGEDMLGGFDPGQGFGGAAGGIVINFTYEDRRFISLNDELDAERLLRPVFDRLWRQKQAGAGA